MTINIIGRAPSWCLCPNNDTDANFCLANIGERMMQHGYKLQGIFQLHAEHLFEDYLARVQHKVYIMNPSSKLPRAKILPGKELIEKFGNRFSSSAAWMMGLAIIMEPEEIGIYGIDMKDSFEYFAQRDMLFYMIGRAEAAGIRVTIPKSSGLYSEAPAYQYKEATT